MMSPYFVIQGIIKNLGHWCYKAYRNIQILLINQQSIKIQQIQQKIGKMAQSENQNQISLQSAINSFLEEEYEQKESFKHRSQKSDFTGLSQGKWQDDENLKYVMFMEFYQTIFISKQKRKYNKIFKTLSLFLKTRNPSQCRSHFQKLMNRYKTFKKILKFHKNYLGVGEYQRRYQEIVKQLQVGQQQTPLKSEQEQAEAKTFASDYVQTDQYMTNLSGSFLNNIPQGWLCQYQFQAYYNLCVMKDFISQAQRF